MVGRELILFLASSIGLCFGFMLEIVLIIEMFLLLVGRANTESMPFGLLTLPH